MARSGDGVAPAVPGGKASTYTPGSSCPPATGKGGRAGGPGSASLRVVTTRLGPGYLRRNGVLCSQGAVRTEYFDRHSAPDGSEWITVTFIVADPTYLTQEFIASTDFKKEPGGAKWNPTPRETT